MLTKDGTQRSTDRGCAAIKPLIVMHDHVTLVAIPLRLQKGVHHFPGNG